MRRSSIFCLTSKTESFGMVLLECKWAALPAVSYDSPNGPRHIISDDGLLIEHNNIKKFAFELSDLIRDEERRVKLSENAFKNRHMFSAKEVMKKWNDLL
ncbi:glycosyltransferase [Chryseobacterium sp. HSC-36S06]|uniref:glycosyltransferase n=1 Tax=Chryseobacterium sp. HSC-36S06 TaxID=2910970 RepID=UPI00209E681C|nr:glycosyltransferase [Chryseobacterium sp. HSC-36S06]